MDCFIVTLDLGTGSVILRVFEGEDSADLFAKQIASAHDIRCGLEANVKVHVVRGGQPRSWWNAYVPDPK